jgi:hypothetical protein
MVYDSTTSAEAITVTSAHTIIYVAEDRLLVDEIYSFDNGGDRTYVGAEDRLVGDGRRETLRFSLPEGAGEVQVLAGLTGCCLFITADGFLHTMPVLPGTTQVAFSYDIMQAGDGYVFTWKSYFPTQQYDFLVQSGTVQLESEGLLQAEPLKVEGVTYTHLAASNLLPGRSLSVRMSGLRPGGGPPAVAWAALATVALAAAAGFFYVRRRRRAEPVAAGGAGEASREELLAELARLDDDFEDGVIAEAEYRKLRSEKKARLLALMKRPGREDGR